MYREDIDGLIELIVSECASICYNSKLEDGDLHAQNLLYEFNIDDARNEKCLLIYFFMDFLV
jgi:hypothetical protein